MAELTCLREEVERLQAENRALAERLAAYERADGLLPAQVVTALTEMHRQYPMQSSSDWIALWWVLTTLAKAPEAFSAFAEWVGALGVRGLPPCKASLLYKADPVYQRPPYRWTENAGCQRSTLQRRLSMAQCLKRMLL